MHRTRTSLAIVLAGALAIFASIAALSATCLNFAGATGVAGAPQTIARSGTGSTGTSSLTLITEPDQQYSSIYNLISSATTSIDMVMYELTDTTVEQELIAAAAKGIKVRVILDASLEKKSNTAAYNTLLAGKVNVVWSNTNFQATHQKTILIDQKTVAIMTLNLTPIYYSTTRDFGVIETNTNDIGAIETTFNSDFTNASNTAYKINTYTPPLGDDLIWSPTNATSALLAIINSATHTLQVENEEMGNATIVTALENAAQRGVQVQVAMTNSGSYTSQFNALVAAKVKVSTYVDDNVSLYIHAKVIIADYGFSSQQAFVGSENFSVASLTENRELGLTITDPTTIQSLHNTLTSDFQGGTPWP